MAGVSSIVECVPNVSEGRDATVIAALAGAVQSVPGVALLDVHADPWHHRSVFTFAGAPAAVADAALSLVLVAVAHINLTRHTGEHPRMGAADVVPFVPLRGAAMDDCVALARQLGARLAERLELPVFLYGRAATRPEHTILTTVRRVGARALESPTQDDPSFVPDFGPRRPHPTAGSTAVGARPILVAFNVWLDTGDVLLARRIARAVRESDGGLRAVQAKGFLVDGRAQVSTNLLDVDVTPLPVVFQEIARRASAAGVAVLKSEIVGLAPARALPANAGRLLRLGDSWEEKILELRLPDVL